MFMFIMRPLSLNYTNFSMILNWKEKHCLGWFDNLSFRPLRWCEYNFFYTDFKVYVWSTNKIYDFSKTSSVTMGLPVCPSSLAQSRKRCQKSRFRFTPLWLIVQRHRYYMRCFEDSTVSYHQSGPNFFVSWMNGPSLRQQYVYVFSKYTWT